MGEAARVAVTEADTERVPVTAAVMDGVTERERLMHVQTMSG